MTGPPFYEGLQGLHTLPDGRIVRLWAGGEGVLCRPHRTLDHLALGFLRLVHLFDHNGPADRRVIRRWEAGWYRRG